MALKEKFKKNAEFTYGVHAGFLAQHVPDNQAVVYGREATLKILEALDEGVMGSVRSLNHKHELLRQAIGYTPMFKIDPVTEEVRFAVYRRNKKNVGTNGEEQLARKLSLGLGGHVERPDIQYYETYEGGRIVDSPVIDFAGTIEDNTDREVNEEVSVYVQVLREKRSDEEDQRDTVQRDITYTLSDTACPVGFVMDSKPEEPGYVGNIHFGVINLVEVPPKVETFEMTEVMNDAIGWFTPGELTAALTDPEVAGLDEFGTEFEPWTGLLIENIDDLVNEARRQSKAKNKVVA